MTTIRRNRVPAPAAVDTDSATPRTAGTPHRRPGDADPVRLTLIDPPGKRMTLDGAWWPRTRNLSDELPGLVRELRRRGIRVTRAAYNPDAWETAPAATGSRRPDHPAAMVPRHRPAAARPDRRHRPRPARSARRPPDTTAAAARQAFAAASDRANRRTPAAVLAALHPAAAPVPAPQPAVDRLAVGQAAPAPAAAAWDAGRAVWDSEGGHPLG